MKISTCKFSKKKNCTSSFEKFTRVYHPQIAREIILLPVRNGPLSATCKLLRTIILSVIEYSFCITRDWTCKECKSLTTNAHDSSWLLLVTAGGVFPLIMLTMVNRDIVYMTLNSRHDNFKICSTEVLFRNCFTGISKIQLSANCHSFFYSPPFSADGSPFSIIEDFNPTLKMVCAAPNANLQQKAKTKWYLCELVESKVNMLLPS